MKKHFKGLMIGFLAIFLVVLGGCSSNSSSSSSSSEKVDRAEADIDWQFIEPAEMKKVIENDNKDSYQIIDIQPKADYAKGHLPNSISIPAYPVDTKELEKLVVDNAEQFKEGKNPIYVVCPGGGGGAKRTISLLIDEGVDKSRLYIVKDGAKKWPYKDDAKVWTKD